MPINKNEITKEMLAKAMQCRTTEELMALAKSEGIEVTKEEAEAYLVWPRWTILSWKKKH